MTFFSLKRTLTAKTPLIAQEIKHEILLNEKGITADVFLGLLK